LPERLLRSSDPWIDTTKQTSLTGWFAATLRDASPLRESPTGSRSPSQGSASTADEMQVQKVSRRLSRTDTISSRQRRQEREAGQMRLSERLAKEKAVEEAALAVLNGEPPGSAAAAQAITALGSLQLQDTSLSASLPTQPSPREAFPPQQPLAHGYLSQVQANGAWRDGLRKGPYSFHEPMRTIMQAPPSHQCLVISSRLAGGSERLDRLPGRFLGCGGLSAATYGFEYYEPELEDDDSVAGVGYGEDVYFNQQFPAAQIQWTSSAQAAVSQQLRNFDTRVRYADAQDHQRSEDSDSEAGVRAGSKKIGIHDRIARAFGDGPASSGPH